MLNRIGKAILLCNLLAFLLPAAHAQQGHIACIGDSITYGLGVKNRARHGYPAQLSRLLDNKYDVRNFGVNNATALRDGDKPYVLQPEFRQATRFKVSLVQFFETVFHGFPIELKSCLR